MFDEAVWHQPSVLLLEKLDHAMPHVADAQEAVVDVDGSNGVKRAQGLLLVISTDSQDTVSHLGYYLLHISFSSSARMLFGDPLRWPLLYILSISRSVHDDAADLHVDLLLMFSVLQNS